MQTFRWQYQLLLALYSTQTTVNHRTYNHHKMWIEKTNFIHRTQTALQIEQHNQSLRPQFRTTFGTAKQAPSKGPTSHIRVSDWRENCSARQVYEHPQITFGPLTALLRQAQNTWNRYLFCPSWLCMIAITVRQQVRSGWILVLLVEWLQTTVR